MLLDACYIAQCLRQEYRSSPQVASSSPRSTASACPVGAGEGMPSVVGQQTDDMRVRLRRGGTGTMCNLMLDTGPLTCATGSDPGVGIDSPFARRECCRSSTSARD